MCRRLSRSFKRRTTSCSFTNEWRGASFRLTGASISPTRCGCGTWLNEGGEVISYAEHVVERFTPTGPDNIDYEATVTDPVVYTRPWTIAYPMRRQKGDLIESACHEEDMDLPHLKILKEAAAQKKKQ